MRVPSASSPRPSFALTGPSAELDPVRHAVRRDLADVRLADRVFAPHYAAPLTLTLTRATPLRAERGREGEVLSTLAAGACFELLEVSGASGWGIAADGRVGFVDADALPLAGS